MKNDVFSWTSPKLEVRDTGEYGKGIFAIENIPKNEILSVHGGYILTCLEEQLLPEDVQDHGTQISEDFVISSQEIEEDDGYFNHSCDPNAGYKGQIFLVAMREIQIGEQVTFDYAMCLYRKDGDEAYVFDCHCGSKNCRGQITDEDWKIRNLQDRYRSYFQWFLQDKIDQGCI